MKQTFIVLFAFAILQGCSKNIVQKTNVGEISSADNGFFVLDLIGSDSIENWIGDGRRIPNDSVPWGAKKAYHFTTRHGTALHIDNLGCADSVVLPNILCIYPDSIIPQREAIKGYTAFQSIDFNQQILNQKPFSLITK